MKNNLNKYGSFSLASVTYKCFILLFYCILAIKQWNEKGRISDIGCDVSRNNKMTKVNIFALKGYQNISQLAVCAG